jgi:hypothetical protein
MDALPPEARTRNVSGKDTCVHCLNHGLVCVSVRVSSEPESPFESYGPCPFCERGFASEFPDSPHGGPWGPDGYWASRSPEEAAAIVKQGGGQHLSVLANRERLEELVEEFERKSQERAAKAEADARDRRIAADQERAQALAELAARDSGEVGDLAERALPSRGIGEGDASTVSAARDPFPVPPPESSTGLFG